MTVCTPIRKEVPYTYTVMIPKTVQKEVTCTTYKCENVMVKEMVPVCKTVCVTCTDECGRCYTHRERVTCMEERTRCVVNRIPVTTKQLVNVTVCEPMVKQGMKTVCDYVMSTKDVPVTVCSYESKVMQGTRTVCEYKTEMVKQKVKYCEMVASEKTIQVPVCSTSCSSPCSDCGVTTHHRGGLFRRGGGCCN